MTLTAVWGAALDVCAGLRGRDLLSVRDLTRDELVGLIALARDIRREPTRYSHVLAGKTLAVFDAVADAARFRDQIAIELQVLPTPIREDVPYEGLG